MLLRYIDTFPWYINLLIWIFLIYFFYNSYKSYKRKQDNEKFLQKNLYKKLKSQLANKKS